MEGQKDQEKTFFETIEAEIEQDIETVSENIEYRKGAILKQKKYMRDSHGDMDDEEFLQNMQNVNTDILFVEHEAKRLETLLRQKASPYFGKLLFQCRDHGEPLPVYIGSNGYVSGKELPDIYDWRAPVSSMFYDYETGAAHYQAPEGDIQGTILEKKQFDIANGKLRHAADTKEAVHDRILLDSLQKNSSTKMRAVVATIQKEQNRLIRNTSAYHLVIDGRAGSGKTVIAMHRLAWLLFNQKTLTADHIMILSPNRLFGDYISSVLPELGENYVPAKEFDELMEEILFADYEYESKQEQADLLIHLGNPDNQRVRNMIYKSSISFFEEFQAFLDAYIAGIHFRDFHFEKLTYEKERLEKMFCDRFSRYPVYERFDKIAGFIIDGLEEQKNCEFSDKQREKLGHQIRKEMIHLYAERNLVALYQAFLDTQKEHYPGIEQVLNEEGKICYEDILPVFYLQVYFYGCHSYDNIRHLLIDEMQDYNIFQYAVLNRIFKCRKTILGDRYQVLFYSDKETVVDILKKVFDTNNSAMPFELAELQTTYRSTKEITEFCNGILRDFSENVLPAEAEPVMRSGKEPEQVLIEDVSDAAAYLAEKLQYGDMDDYDNIAVLCDSEEEAFVLYEALSGYTDVTLITGQSTVYTGGVAVLPKFLAKGMEFDVVFVLQESAKPENVISRNAYYISCTRALHELYVLYRKTGEDETLK